MSIHTWSARKIKGSAVLKDLRKLVARITTQTDPEMIILFGSLARDQFTEASDIDLLLVYDDIHQVKKARKLLFSGERLSSYPLDILFYDKKRFEEKKEVGGVVMVAWEEGKILHERNTYDSKSSSGKTV